MTGVELSREELVTRLRAQAGATLREQWEALKEESLCELAAVIRGRRTSMLVDKECEVPVDFVEQLCELCAAYQF